MKVISIQNCLVLLIAMICFAGPVWAQQVVRFDGAPATSDVRVDGSSTLHDWTVKSPSINGHIDFKFDVPPNATAQQIREAIIANPKAEVAVEIPVDTMKSLKKDKDMDKKMYDALKRDKNPSIKYELTQLSLAKDANAQQDECKIKTTGNLTVAGVARAVQIPMTLRVVDAQHLKISGGISMKMTDFNVKPPQALFGAIKSADAIDVRFEWNTVRRDAE